MAITNPDSLLDKNGLAYYHSKVKDMIRDATKVNVNVIQSEHQRIGYSIESNNYGLQPVTEVQSGEIYYNSNWGEWVEGYIENGSFVNGSNVKILFAPEDGYSCGNLVLNLDGRALIEDEDYEVNHQYQAGKYNYYEVYIFVAYGGFLTISATPATPATVTDTSVSTYEMVIGEDTGNGWFDVYGYMPNMSTGSFTCTVGYDDQSYGGFYEMFYSDGSGGYTGCIGFCDSGGGIITRQNQPTYKIFYNNQLIYDSLVQDMEENVSSLSDAILASRVGQTVTIKVY